MKKTLSIILSICLLLSTLPMFAVNAYAESVLSGFHYEMNDDGTVTITGNANSELAVYDIPTDILVMHSHSEYHADYDYYRVTGINISDNSYINTLKVPHTVTKMSVSNCPNLDTIDIPFFTMFDDTGLSGDYRNPIIVNCSNDLQINYECPESTWENASCYIDAYATVNFVGPVHPSATDFGYTLNDNYEIELTSYSGTESDIILPSSIDGYPVTSLGDNLFFNNSTVRTVVIPDGVQHIGNYSLHYCPNLERIVIPSTVDTLRVFSIAYNQKLSEIIVDPNNQSFDTIVGNLYSKDKTTLIRVCENNTFGTPYSETFASSSSSQDIHEGEELPSQTISDEYMFIMPRQVTTIDEGAFMMNEHLGSVFMLDSDVQTIGFRAFNSCNNLKQIIIPDCLETIAESAFSSCTSLNSVYYGGKIEDYNNISVDYTNNDGENGGNEALRNAQIYCLSPCDNHTITNSTVITSPTCTTSGTESFYCPVCNGNYTAELPPAGHSWDNGTVTTAATCSTNGTTTYTCTACGETKTKTVYATGHSWGNRTVTRAATCTINGMVKYTCVNCGGTKIEYITATGHSWDNGTVTTPATCTTDGTTTYTCTICGETRTEAISATGHTMVQSGSNMVCSVCGYSTGSGNDYELPKIPLTHTHIPSQTPVIENEVSATCTTGGSYDSVVRCVTCNIELSRETVETDPLGHDYVGVVTEPGCTTEGYTTYTCSRCNDSYNGDYTSPLGHTPLEQEIENEVPANCTTGGSYDAVVYCGECFAEISRDTVETDPLGHSPAAAVRENEVSATCTTGGSYENVVYCSRCNTEINRSTVETDPLGHNYTDAVTEPGCIAKGYNTHTCTRCNDSYVDTYVMPTGHKPTAEVRENEVSATCTTGGSYDAVVYCSNCNMVIRRESVVVDPLGHQYYAIVTEPTATTGGCTTYICEVCGDSYVGNYTDPIGSGDPNGGEVNYDEPDFDALNALLEKVSDFDENDYSAESFAAFRQICDKYADYENSIVTQAQIDFAIKDILSAITELVPYININVRAENGSVTVNSQSTDSARVLKGTDVTLVATPDSGYTFKGWYDSDVNRLLSTSSTYSFTVSSNKNIEAQFVKTGLVTLTFMSASGQVVNTVTKTSDAWADIDSIESLLPTVPFSYGKVNGRWVYNDNDVLSALCNGENVTITPEYDTDDTVVPEVPAVTSDEPALELTYTYNEDSKVGSFLLALGVPENCEIEEIGTALYYKKAAEFNPAEFELIVNKDTFTSKFTETSEGIYITNIKNFSSKYNWAARGYVTYRDADGNLKTVYSNQVNIVDRQQV